LACLLHLYDRTDPARLCLLA